MSFLAAPKHHAHPDTPPVVMVRPNVWRITFAESDRPSRRARHGRARWSLSAGLRRQPTFRLGHRLVR